MKNRSYTTYIKLLMFLLVVLSLKEARAALNVHPKAKVVLLYDLDQRAVLFERKSTKRHHPASLTKLFTLALALKELSDKEISSKFSVPKKAIRYSSAKERLNMPYLLDPRGTRLWLLPNEKLKCSTLLKSMMAISANDATNVLAMQLGKGSFSAATAKLNAFAKSIGCSDTNFMTLHGLYHPNQYSTANDFKKLILHVLDDPRYVYFAATKKFTKEPTAYQKSKTFKHFCKLYKEGPFYYPFLVFAKTGTHSHAGANLVVVAKKGHRRLLVVLMGNKDARQGYRDAIELFEEGFKLPLLYQVVYPEKDAVFSYVDSTTKIQYTACLDHDLTVAYYEGYPKHTKAITKWSMDPKKTYYPGEKVGEVTVYPEDSEPIKGQLLLASRKEPYSYLWLWVTSAVGLCMALVLLRTSRVL